MRAQARAAREPAHGATAGNLRRHSPTPARAVTLQRGENAAYWRTFARIRMARNAHVLDFGLLIGESLGAVMDADAAAACPGWNAGRSVPAAEALFGLQQAGLLPDQPAFEQATQQSLLTLSGSVPRNRARSRALRVGTRGTRVSQGLNSAPGPSASVARQADGRVARRARTWAQRALDSG